MKKSHEPDSMDRAILRIAVPSIVSNVTVPLLGLVDLTLSGHLGRTEYIGAIAVGTMVFNVMYWLCGFLRMSTGGFTAQAVGAGRLCDAAAILRRSVAVALSIALFLLLFQQPLLWLSLRLIGPSPEVAVQVQAYFRLLIWGAPAVLCTVCLNGWFIGMQDARWPMRVAIVQNVINILVSLAAVVGFGLKVEGVALGTLVAQWSGLCLYLVALRRVCPRGGAAGRGVAWSAFFRVNRNIFLRTLCLVAVQLWFTAGGAGRGDVVLAVNALLLQFYTLFSYFMDGFAYAGEALGGMFCGARDGVRFRALTCRLFVWGGGFVGVFTLGYWLGGEALLRLLTDDAAVLAAATEFLPYAVLIPLCGVAAFLFDGLCIGTTSTGLMLLSSAVAAVVFFALAAVPSNHFLWLAMLAFLAVRGIVLALGYGRMCSER